MVFHSYTYDSSEVDLQHGLDKRGNEIREIVYDTGFSGNGTLTLPIDMHDHSKNSTKTTTSDTLEMPY